ncbi:hypothetical protein [Bacillus sp. 179-C3.3 HS]|uniref:hypothetical protein n=1 Tax=Bacillus sp. 179-C3.3 HS TaxID=3232162 RepID=UPI0039A01D7B
MVSSFFVLMLHQIPFCSYDDDMRKGRIVLDIMTGLNVELIQFVGLSLLCEYAYNIQSFHLYKKSMS